MFRKKKFRRTKKETQYDEDDPEAYKDMPVPDKVTKTMISLSYLWYKYQFSEA